MGHPVLCCTIFFSISHWHIQYWGYMLRKIYQKNIYIDRDYSSLVKINCISLIKFISIPIGLLSSSVEALFFCTINHIRLITYAGSTGGSWTWESLHSKIFISTKWWRKYEQKLKKMSCTLFRFRNKMCNWEFYNVIKTNFCIKEQMRWFY